MIAIIGAMTEEVEAVTALMTEPVKIEDEVMTVFKGKLSGVDVVVSQSGIGKANAAMNTAYLFKTYDIQGVINVGSAGGLKPEQNYGDLVVATSTTYYDLCFSWAEPRKDLANYTFQADPDWLKIMEKSITELNLPYWLGEIATGDQFIEDDSQVALVKSRCPEAMAVEMEGCAIAQVASKWHKPFVILRSLSDIAVRPGNAEAFEIYLPKAAANSAKLCKLFLENGKMSILSPKN